jgi:hypothetical protein
MRTYTKILLLCLPLLAVATSANAQGLPQIADVKALTDKVMTSVAKGDLEGGLKMFKSQTIIPSAEFDAMMGQAVTQMPLMTARFGNTLGQEFIKEVRVGESLAELIYIHRFDKHAMRWQFYLYRGKNGWVINTFRFDDRWPELLDRQ